MFTDTNRDGMLCRAADCLWSLELALREILGRRMSLRSRQIGLGPGGEELLYLLDHALLLFD
jgi:hypothetical protein